MSDNGNLSSTLTNAIKSNDLQKVLKLLKSGVLINITDEDNSGNTPLQSAVELGRKRIVEELLNHGADTDRKNKNRDTALHIAVREGSIEIVQLLLSANADAHLPNSAGLSPLEIAENSNFTNKDEIIRSFDVYKRLRVFLQNFVVMYKSFLSDAWEELDNQTRKPGKIADFLNEMLEIGKDGSDMGGSLSAPFKVFLNVIQKGISGIGNKIHRDGLKKLLIQMCELKENPGIVQRNLVESGIQIFRSFESQFTQITSDNTWQRGMKKLAEDAVSRTLNYYRMDDNVSKEFSMQSIVNGVFFGTSKRFSNTSTNTPHILEGHTVSDPRGRLWNTAKMFNNVGLVLVDNNGTCQQFYKKINSADDIIFGYRRKLEWELENIVKPYIETSSHVTYKYMIGKEDMKRYANKVDILINEESVAADNILSAEIRDLANSLDSLVSEHYNELRQYINDNMNKIRDHMKKHEEANKDIKKIVTNTQEIILDVKETVLNIIESKNNKLPNGIDSMIGYQEIKPIWFDVKEPTTPFMRHEQLTKLIEFAASYDTVLICGLGGVGKSELAVNFAHETFNAENHCVIFIHAETDETITNSFRRLMKKLELKTIDVDGEPMSGEVMAEKVYEYLANFKEKGSLVIFDNVEIYATIYKYLSRKNKIFNIITSRNSELITKYRHGDFEKLYLDTLSSENAAKMVKKLLGINTCEQDEDVLNFVNVLGCLPLALKVAASYISSTHYDEKILVKEYISIFKKSQSEMNDILNLEECKNYKETIFLTIKAAIDRIQKNNNVISKLALKILNIISYISPDNILKEFFVKLAMREAPKLSGSIKQLHANKTLSKAINLLQRNSIIMLDSGKINIHRLVQEAIQFNTQQKTKINPLLFRKKTEEEEVLSETIDIMVELMKENNFSIANHFLVIWKHASKYATLEKKIIRKLNVIHKYPSELLFSPERAKLFYTDIIILQRKHYGHEHYKIAETLKKLGYCYGRLGDLEKQKEMQEQAMDIQIKHYGADHYNLADTLMELSYTYKRLNNRAKEANALERTRIILVKQYGPNHLILDDVLTALKLCYEELCNYEKKINVIESVLQIYIKHYGSEHHMVAFTLNELDRTYKNIDSNQIKIKIMEHALQTRIKQFGSDHKAVGDILLHLTSIYHSVGNHTKKIDSLENALKIKIKRLRPDHYMIADMLLLLHFSCRDLGMQEKCIEVLSHVLQIQEKYYGQHHDVVAESLFHLGNAYKALGHNDKKSEVHARVLKILKRHKIASLEVCDTIFRRDHTILFNIVVNEKYYIFNRNFYDAILQSAIYSDSENAIIYLVNELKKVDSDNLDKYINTVDSSGHTPLMWTIERKFARAAKVLLEHNADTNRQLKGGITVLFLAVEPRGVEFCKILLENKANVNFQSKWGLTALHQAVGYQNVELCKLLIDNKAQVNLQDYNGKSALHQAVQKENFELCKLLIDNKAEVNLQTADNETALHIAAEKESVELCKLLINNGADVTLQNKWGKSALCRSKIQNDELCKLLIDNKE